LRYLGIMALWYLYHKQKGKGREFKSRQGLLYFYYPKLFS